MFHAVLQCAQMNGLYRQNQYSRYQRQLKGVMSDRHHLLRTCQKWLYLAVVMDLHVRKVVGWSMKHTIAREIVLDALMMAVWRQRPMNSVFVHSDQGSQYGNDDWKRFCDANNLELSMSPRGNCWDTQSTISLSIAFGLTRADVFDYIEGFYNRAGLHTHLGSVSPEAFERASV